MPLIYCAEFLLQKLLISVENLNVRPVSQWYRFLLLKGFWVRFPALLWDFPLIKNYFTICHSVRKVSDLFVAKTWWISIRRAFAPLNLHTHTWIFFRLSIVSVGGKQRLSDAVSSALISDFHCKENERTTGAAHFIQVFFLAISSDIRKLKSLANHRSLVFCQKTKVWNKCTAPVVP